MSGNRYNSENRERQDESREYPDALNDNTVLRIIQNRSDNHGCDTAKHKPKWFRRGYPYSSDIRCLWICRPPRLEPQGTVQNFGQSARSDTSHANTGSILSGYSMFEYWIIQSLYDVWTSFTKYVTVTTVLSRVFSLYVIL